MIWKHKKIKQKKTIGKKVNCKLKDDPRENYVNLYGLGAASEIKRWHQFIMLL